MGMKGVWRKSIVAGLLVSIGLGGAAEAADVGIGGEAVDYVYRIERNTFGGNVTGRALLFWDYYPVTKFKDINKVGEAVYETVEELHVVDWRWDTGQKVNYYANRPKYKYAMNWYDPNSRAFRTVWAVEYVETRSLVDRDLEDRSQLPVSQRRKLSQLSMSEEFEFVPMEEEKDSAIVLAEPVELYEEEVYSYAEEDYVVWEEPLEEIAVVEEDAMFDFAEYEEVAAEVLPDETLAEDYITAEASEELWIEPTPTPAWDELSS